MANSKKPMSAEKIRRLREQIRVDNVRRSFQEPVKVSLPRFSWDRDKDAGLQEQKDNG